jgi:hemerythrin
MHLIEWDYTYELGIETIDGHHRQLIELLNQTYDLLLHSADKAEIQTILQELLRYTEYHFAAEEQLMNEAGYKGLVPHIAKHDGFKDRLAVLLEDYRSGSPDVNTDMVLFLSVWLRKHILHDDRKFASYLKPAR